MVKTPYEKIKKTCVENLPNDLIEFIPRKWERIGDILIIVIPKKLEHYKNIIGEIYANILKCKTVLRDIGGVYGIFREPRIEIIFGQKNTVTIHRENNIKYRLDPTKIMFSSGNINERIRMGYISNENETIVDLFAGIGYFTLPIAVYSNPNKIYACELNPVSYGFLCENIVLNHVTDIVKPLLGDNRKTAPENICQRVIMGYLKDNARYLPTAINSLKNGTGILHYHDKCSVEYTPDKSLNIVKNTVKKFNKKVKLLGYKIIKSYAPKINHIVLDIEIL